MKLVEQHQFKFNHEMDELCFKSKNLYNSCLYALRQEFIETGKFIPYCQLNKMFMEEKNPDYYALPTKVAQQTMKLVDQNFKSFFRAIKQFKKNPKKFLGRPKLPKYKDSKNGRSPVIYTIQSISKKEFRKSGMVLLSQTGLKINTQVQNFEDIQQVRIIPKQSRFTVEIVYKATTNEPVLNDNYAAIDIGLNNLATVSFNDGQKPFIIKGTPLKSTNQFFNKQKAKFQSQLELRNKTKWSNRLERFQTKRNNKIKDYMHKASRLLVNQLVSRDISVLIIGKNKNWKQDINIGRRNNQGFVSIPHGTFIEMLSYKCALAGIQVIEQEESYTSKCSFLDSEQIKKHEVYAGRRVKRGLFKSRLGKFINADLNASYNIMRKAISDYLLVKFDGIEDAVVHPRLLSV